MVSLTSLISFTTLAVAALAAPLPAVELEARSNVYHCHNDAMLKKGFTISQANAVAAMNSSPHEKGKSSYPHPFMNHGGISFQTEQCKHGNLLEFPVMIDGKLYDAQGHHPKADPGPARVIFVQENQPHPHRVFCGVVAHTGQNKNPNMGFLALCTDERVRVIRLSRDDNFATALAGCLSGEAQARALEAQGIGSTADLCRCFMAATLQRDSSIYEVTFDVLEGQLYNFAQVFSSFHNALNIVNGRQSHNGMMPAVVHPFVHFDAHIFVHQRRGLVCGRAPYIVNFQPKLRALEAECMDPELTSLGQPEALDEAVIEFRDTFPSLFLVESDKREYVVKQLLMRLHREKRTGKQKAASQTQKGKRAESVGSVLEISDDDKDDELADELDQLSVYDRKSASNP